MNTSQKPRTLKAFTVFEVIAAVVIVAILATLSVMSYRALFDRFDREAAVAEAKAYDREYQVLLSTSNTGAGLAQSDVTAAVNLSLNDLAATDASEINHNQGDTTDPCDDQLSWVPNFDQSITVLMVLSCSPGTPSTVIIDGTTISTGTDEGNESSGLPESETLAFSYANQEFSSAATTQILNPTTTGSVGTLTYAITAGTLPDGVFFNSSTGEFVGSANWAAAFTDTVPVSSSGTYECSGPYDGYVVVNNDDDCQTSTPATDNTWYNPGTPDTPGCSQCVYLGETTVLIGYTPVTSTGGDPISGIVGYTETTQSCTNTYGTVGYNEFDGSPITGVTGQTCVTLGGDPVYGTVGYTPVVTEGGDPIYGTASVWGDDPGTPGTPPSSGGSYACGGAQTGWNLNGSSCELVIADVTNEILGCATNATDNGDGTCSTLGTAPTSGFPGSLQIEASDGTGSVDIYVTLTFS